MDSFNCKNGEILMNKTDIEILFEWLDQTTEMIQAHEDEPYLDSLAITMEALFYGEPPVHMNEVVKHRLQSAIQTIDLKENSKEDIRKAIQLVVLKGMQRTTQSQHLMTPETISLFMAYLAGKLAKDSDSGRLRVFDPAGGTGSLLTTVISQLPQDVEAYASEVDPTLLHIALYNANLQQIPVEFFHQDSLRPLLLDPVDLIVADLPVGFYPDDIVASEYQLKAEEGHSYAHHLFIEQSLHYLKEGGYLLALIPDFLFDSDQSDKLHTYLQENAHIVGVLRLPESSFKSKKNVKSVLILQKMGEGTIAPKQPLLVNMPSFKNTLAIEDILTQINDWFATHHPKKQK